MNKMQTKFHLCFHKFHVENMYFHQTSVKNTCPLPKMYLTMIVMNRVQLEAGQVTKMTDNRTD